MSQFIIAGNWKMFKTVPESIKFVQDLHCNIAQDETLNSDEVEILIFPSTTALYPLKDPSPYIQTGAQNFYPEEKGAFTGEISPPMLKNVVDFVLIGHSERREIFKETDELINKKIKSALEHGFEPMLCIGESLAEREAGNTFNRLEEQLKKDLDGLTAEEVTKLVIAYEPIWAIGTGKTATPEQAQEVHAHIRNFLSKKYPGAETVKILYGGSVKPENSEALLSQNDINGALIGGASLKLDSFCAIIRTSVELIK